MRRILVVVFDDESKATEGEKVLWQLDREGSISIYDYASVAKRADGTTIVKWADEHRPFNTFAGVPRSATETSADAVTSGLAAPTRTHAGELAELHPAVMDEAFISDVTKVLLPNRVALIADIEEEFATPVDRRMESLGGIMFRWVVGE